MIKAICFDFDGVSYFEKERMDIRLNRELNTSKEKMAEFFKNEFITCQEGKLDLKVAIKPHLKEWKWEKTVDELLDYWFSNGEINLELLELAKALRKKGVTTVLITNNEKRRFEYMENKYHLSKMFDIVIASCEIKARKPSAEFFNAIVSKTRAAPQEIIFIEDEEKIIQKAKEFGFKVYKYINVQTVKDELKQVLK